jgi:hypothetical protein
VRTIMVKNSRLPTNTEAEDSLEQTCSEKKFAGCGTIINLFVRELVAILIVR